MEKTTGLQWEPAKIYHQVHPRSFIIEDKFGKLKRRNISNLKKTDIAFKQKTFVPDIISEPSNPVQKSKVNPQIPEPYTPPFLGFPESANERNLSSGVQSNNEDSFSTPISNNNTDPVRRTRFGREIKTPRRLNI